MSCLEIEALQIRLDSVHDVEMRLWDAENILSRVVQSAKLVELRQDLRKMIDACQQVYAGLRVEIDEAKAARVGGWV